MVIVETGSWITLFCFHAPSLSSSDERRILLHQVVFSLSILKLLHLFVILEVAEEKTETKRLKTAAKQKEMSIRESMPYFKKIPKLSLTVIN